MAKLKSQQVNRELTSINDEYKHIKYTYLYVDESEKAKTEVKRGDLKGYHEIGKPKTSQIKSNGKVIGWTWEAVYQKN